MEESSMSDKTIAILVSIPIAIVLFFALCFRTVGAGQVGVVTRFGEINRQVGSGVTIKFPWPIERLNKMDVKIQKQEQDAASATADLQDVNAKLAVNYALNSEKAGDVFKTLGSDYHERVIAPAVQESFKAATTQYTASDLLTKRSEVKQKIVDVIKKRVEPYGIRIEDVSIVNFTFSAEFTKAIEARQVAAQEAQKAQFNLERARLDAQAQEAQKTSLSPELLQKQAIEKWDGKMPQYVGGGAVFNIPLVR